VTIKKVMGPAHAHLTRAGGGGREGKRYPCDLTDREWALIAALLPARQRAGRGRPPVHPKRAIVEAILYVVRTGCAWRYLPGEYPPWRTVYGYFTAWQASGVLDQIHDALRARARIAAGRRPAPSAAVIDSQSVRAADTVARASRGWDNGKKVNGRKRHIAVDTLGLLLAVVVTPASVQDRDGARPLLWRLRASSRHVRLAWADAGYAGKLITWAAALHLVIEVVRKRDPHAFEVLPRRWVVERTFAWISKHRRCVRDYERLPEHHEAMVKWAMIALMARRLARQPPAAQPTRAVMPVTLPTAA
jgi:putative transposase